MIRDADQATTYAPPSGALGGSPLAVELNAVAATLRASTVQVANGGPGAGSGVIWSADGLIVTNAHVARGQRARVTLADGRELAARVTARDERADLASLRVDATGLASATVGDPRVLRAGEIVVALGNPWGIVGATSVGIVHTVECAELSRAPQWIRADVRLAPGNSGGPLADAAGRVVGINAMIVNGLGVAVPTTTVTRFLARGVARPRLGVSLRPVSLSVNASSALGLLLMGIEPRSVAERAGFIVGDIIVATGGRPLRTADDLLEYLTTAPPAETLQFTIVRGGERGARDIYLSLDSSPGARAA